MKIAIFGSENQKEAQLEKIFGILRSHKADIYVQADLYTHIPSSIKEKYGITNIIDCDTLNADLALSIGGDGTFLRTASFMGKKDIPIIGVNAGRLGFLADISSNDIEEALTDILAGKYRIEHRSQLELKTANKGFKGFNCALNEIAILKQDTASMITIHASINDEYLTSFEADGLVISTPTGSTAYSLAAGGPIMAPTASSFIITAIAPHSLSNRPLVVNDDSIITLDIESRNGSFLVSLDGRSEVFATGTKLTIEKAEFTLKVVKRLGHTFYATLRDKLMWGADPRK